MSTLRSFRIGCDGDGCSRMTAEYSTAAMARKMAARMGWKSVAGNGAARGPHRTERTDWCPNCRPPR